MEEEWSFLGKLERRRLGFIARTRGKPVWAAKWWASVATPTGGGAQAAFQG
jgi:hypothetical protein